MIGQRLARWFGFTAGPPGRLLVTLLYAALFAGAIAWVEARSVRARPHAQPPASIGGVAGGLYVTITASFEVGEWEVLLDGLELVPDFADGRRWEGAAEAEGAHELLIDVQARDGAGIEEDALRVVVRAGSRTIERTIWGIDRLSLLIDLAGGLEP